MNDMAPGKHPDRVQAQWQLCYGDGREPGVATIESTEVLKISQPAVGRSVRAVTSAPRYGWRLIE